MHLKLLDPIASHRPSESSTSHSVLAFVYATLKPRLIQFFFISLYIFIFHPSFIAYSSHGLPSHVLSSMFIMAPTACVRSCPLYPLRLMSKSLRQSDLSTTVRYLCPRRTNSREHVFVSQLQLLSNQPAAFYLL